MTKSTSITLILAFSFCCLALNSTSAQNARPACGDTNTATGPDFRTFRQLASPAINQRAKTIRAPQAAAPNVSSVNQVSHTERASASSSDTAKRVSPPASRIPSQIFVDPDVATIRLLSVSQSPVDAAPPSQPSPAEKEIAVRRTAAPPRLDYTAPSTLPQPNTQRPTPHSVVRNNQMQSNGLLKRIINTDAAAPGILPDVQSQPVCAANNTPAIRTPAEPFSNIARNEAWDISTRRPRNTTHVSTVPPGKLQDVAADQRQLRPIREIAPVPEPTIKQASATEEIPSRSMEQTFWVQSPSFASVPSKQSAQPTAISDPAPARSSEKSPTKIVEDANGKHKVATGKWATMPIPGRPCDQDPEKEPQSPAQSKLEPRKWAGLFVEEMKGGGRVTSNGELMQISFDAPISDTAKPGEFMLVQADGPAKEAAEPNKAPRRRSRLRLDFLDDPDEKNADPTQDAIRAILGEDDKNSKLDDLRSILEDDEEMDKRSHREKYDYAYEEILPKPIVKSPRNYAPTLKDILADRSVDPWVEQAYCAAVWECAGGKGRSQLSQLNEKLDRNKQVIWGCGQCGLSANRCNCGNSGYSSNSNLPWGISPTRPRGRITACRLIRGGGWCTGACGGHCDVGCKVVCPRPGGSCSCTDESCTGEACNGGSCTGEGEVADAIEAACTE